MTNTAEITYNLALLDRAKWDASPGLRAVYEHLFRMMMRETAPGRILEVGSGIGAIREFFPEVTTSDVAETPYVDRAVSCYEIRETSGQSWDNILALDVLHHLQRPLEFLASASEALRPGGRVILNEPAATWGGTHFYRLFHHEPCRAADLVPPFEMPPDNEAGEFANMGMAAALFLEHRPWVEKKLRALGLTLVQVRFRDLLAYPASGGFSRPQFLSTPVLRALLVLEKSLPQWLLRAMALRVTIVVEKSR